MEPSELTRAYERGRLRRALRMGALVVPMIGLSMLCCGERSLTGALGAVLLAATVYLVHRGGVAGRAVPVGLAAGLVPFLVPLVAGAACGAGDLESFCLPACIVGGVVAGAIVAARARAFEGDRRRFVLFAGAIAATAGALGCLLMGVVGIVAMLFALAAISIPVVWRPATS